MFLIFVSFNHTIFPLDVTSSSSSSISTSDDVVIKEISELLNIPSNDFYVSNMGGTVLSDISEYDTIIVNLMVNGGIDFQHREGSKIRSGGVSSEAQAAIERKERLRKLALETIDISKDPYIMKNHLGAYECKLCLTLHPNEGNYLAHTQGKRHQSNLGRRAAMEAKQSAPKIATAQEVVKKRVLKIGRPGYKVSYIYMIFFFYFFIIRIKNICPPRILVARSQSPATHGHGSAP